MKKLKVGIIGMGFIGGSHIDAVRRLGTAELVAVADAVPEVARKKAAEYGVPNCYDSIDSLLGDTEIDVIHNCTPNNLHLPVNRRIIESGRHVFSEKPLSRTAAESAEMLELLRQHPDVVAGVNFCYRMNPLAREIRRRIALGEIGRPLVVQGTYLQDWLLYDTDYNWRIEEEVSGPSRCVGDIGSHWMDLAQNLTGSRITEVCADTFIAHPTRKKPLGVVETFSANKSGEYEEVPVTTEDYAAVLLRFDNGARGWFSCSEIAAGRKCRLDIEIDGGKGSYYWNQEQSDRMWMGDRDGFNKEIMRNPGQMDSEAAKYSYLAAGHPEGWNDAMRNNVAAFYQFILDGKKHGTDVCDFATFEEAHYIMRLTEAILQSAREKCWITVE